jgi:thymidylate synthase
MRMTLLITHNSIGKSHEDIVHRIASLGTVIETEDGELTKEITDVRIKITNPMDEPRISPHCFMGKKGFDEYTKNLIYGSDKKFVYDYHERLFRWGSFLDEMESDKIGERENQLIQLNQIDYIIAKLTIFKNSRRAIAVTWIPPLDVFRKDVPCLQLVQCIVRNSKLDMYIVFRSEDMLSAFGQNAYALTSLQKYIADKLAIPVGTYYHYIISAHIYHKRDAHELSKFTGA